MRTRFFIAALLCSLLLFLCGPASAQEGADTPKPLVIRVATIIPGGMGWTKRAKEILIPKMAEMAGDRIALKIYWGGVKGDDGEILAQMRAGQMDGAALSGYGTILACPEFAVLSLPFLFNGWDEVDHIRDTMFPVFDQFMQSRGFRMFLWVDQDFDQVYSTRFPPVSLEEFRRCEFLRWYGDLEKLLFMTLGVQSVPARVPEVPSVISEGSADAAIAPAMWVLGSQVFSMVKYVLPCKIRYSPAVVVMSPKAVASLPPDLMEKFFSLRDSVSREFISYSRADSEKCLQAMIAYGIKEVRMDEKNMAQFSAIAKTLYDRASGVLYPRSLLDQVQQNLAAYRKARKP
ncbi:MAG: TRAP transporter substrate-binding protein DctP [Thermodesulfobacteriota bacterium]